MDLILYSAVSSNCSQRVEWAFKYKKIPYTLNISGNSTSGAFGFIPSLSIDGKIISASMAILEFLEGVFSNFECNQTS